jgi:hypothetical protein
MENELRSKAFSVPQPLELPNRARPLAFPVVKRSALPSLPQLIREGKQQMSYIKNFSKALPGMFLATALFVGPGMAQGQESPADPAVTTQTTTTTPASTSYETKTTTAPGPAPAKVDVNIKGSSSEPASSSASSSKESSSVVEKNTVTPPSATTVPDNNTTFMVIGGIVLLGTLGVAGYAVSKRS